MELNLTCDIFKKSCVIESNVKSSLEKRCTQKTSIPIPTDVYQDVKDFVKKTAGIISSQKLFTKYTQLHNY